MASGEKLTRQGVVRKSYKRPAQFTEQDEKELKSLAEHIWQSIGHDLPEGIHVRDYIDCMHGQIGFSRGHYHTGSGSSVYLITDDLKVCRDTEMQGQRVTDWTIDPRPGDIAQDVLEAFYHYDNPGHHWAIKTVETHMRRHADKRGIIR